MRSATTPVDAFLRSLRRELRPLGWRRRRGALAEARDHLLSTIEQLIDEGMPSADAEQRAIERFGEPSEIAARLCAVRPARGRRVVPTLVGAATISVLIAFAAGPVSDQLATHEAAAAAPVSPSEQGCAQAFDRAANAPLRARLTRQAVSRVQIFATTVPSCVVKFQLAEQRVLTAGAPWKARADLPWKATISRHGRVAGANAGWSAGLLTATGPLATQTRTLGPGPTAASCVDTWNAAPPALPAIHGTPLVYVQALNGGIQISNSGGGRPSIQGNACGVSIVRAADRVLFLAAAWHQGQASRWDAPLSIGLIAGEVPNAVLLPGGRLGARPQTSVAAPPVSPASSTPGIAREIGVTGWAGGVRLDETLAQIVARFGKPSSLTTSGLSCQADWARLGLSATFSFGRVARGAARGKVSPCATNGMATSFTGADTWSTTNGLRVGMPESAIQQRYPGAGHVAASDGSTTWFLVPRSGTSSRMPLTASTSALGTVVSISIGAAPATPNAGASTGVFIWGKASP
jgi:hypothetical protein